MSAEVDDVQIVLDYFVSQYYYGPVMEVALPTFYPEGVSKCKVISDAEVYSPVPYVVAVYRLVNTNNNKTFGYKFTGVEIRNND